MPIIRDNVTYLDTLEAQGYVGGRSYTWLADRVKAGKLKKYHFGDGVKPYYRHSELDALTGASVLEEHEPAHVREELEGMYTIPEVARALGVSRGYIWKLVRKEHKIEAINLGGGGRSADYRIAKDELERFKKERGAAAR